MTDFKAKLAALRAAKAQEEANKQESHAVKQVEERRVAERRQEDRREEPVITSAEEYKTLSPSTYTLAGEAAALTTQEIVKKIEKSAAVSTDTVMHPALEAGDSIIIRELEEKKANGTISPKEKIQLLKLQARRKQNVQAEEAEQKTGDDLLQDKKNEVRVSSETTSSKEQNETSQGSSFSDSTERTSETSYVELAVATVSDEEKEYHKLLFKEETSSLTLKERILLNKLKVKYAPPPIDLPGVEIKTVQEDYGVTDEQLEKQDEALQSVESRDKNSDQMASDSGSPASSVASVADSVEQLKEEVSSKSPIGFLPEADMRKALEEQERKDKEALEKEKQEKAQKIAEAIAIAKATQSLQQERKKLSFKEMLEAKRKAQEEASLAMDDFEGSLTEVLTSALEADENPLAQAISREQTVSQEKEQGKLETFSINITLNAEQLMAKELAFAGKSFCLIGAAGTGKTSTQRDVAKSLVQSGSLRTTSFKIPNGGGQRKDAPSIAFCAYTRRASANLARAIHKDPELSEVLQHNIMTVHHLLEYEPVQFYDEEKKKESMRFEPQRHAGNPLEITHLVIEEASMLGLDLWENLYAALPFGVQIIFIGDINQLPPVFGSSILNYALVQLPVVELKTVYRQAGDSLVLANAHNILKGKSLEEGKGFNIVRGKSPVQVGQGKMAQTLAVMFKQLYKTKEYNPDDCIILTPFNKQDLGTDMMNKHIAQFLGEDRQAVVHEVLAGVNKHYLAVGDKVMFNKQDGVITSISRNGLYHGKEPQLPGTDLTRFGIRIFGAGSSGFDLDDDSTIDYSNFSVDDLAVQAAERKQQASHVITIEMETGLQVTLENAGDFGQQVFSLAYCLTVHKAQGCEWRKVYGILHKDHAVMLNRELFYTMVTRAREEVVLIAKDTVIEKAIRTQKIKGDSLQDKIEYFNSGALDAGAVSCIK